MKGKPLKFKKPVLLLASPALFLFFTAAVLRNTG
jgi:hypothetical protein